MVATIQAENGMTGKRALCVSIPVFAVAAGNIGTAMAQACTREGDAVSCDDGRRGLLSGDARALSSKADTGSREENAAK
jgi:hypothetical protein